MIKKYAVLMLSRYVGLSSSGMTYKSSSAGYGSSSFQQSDRYGAFGDKRDGEMFKDSYRDRDRLGGEESSKSSREKSRRGVSGDGEGKNSKKGSIRQGRFVHLYLISSLDATVSRQLTGVCKWHANSK